MLDPSTLAIDPDISRAATLPAAWYVDPSSLPLEKERIFATTWQYATALTKLSQPGSYMTLEIAGIPVVLIRDHEGRLKGFHNVCRHRAGPVAVGEGQIQALKCAYHGWTYGLDGALKFTPEMKGVECFDKADFGLAPVDVDTYGPFIFCRLRPGGPRLAEYLGAIPAETAKLPLAQMRLHKRLTYELSCNWKVYVDNYLEGYHIPQVHPELFRMLSYPEYRVETHRYYSKQYAPIKPAGAALYTRNLPAGQEPEALYYWVFPNLMFNIYPDNVQINAILPIDHQRTATVFEWYLLDPDRPNAAEEFAASLAFSDLVQKEDIMICEHVQKGLGSKVYDKGRFAPARENGVHHFHSLVAEFLQGKGGSQ